MAGLASSERFAAPRRPWGWTLGDAGLAVLLLAVMMTEVVPNPEMTPRLPLLLLSLPLTLPLAWRLRHPVVCVVTVAGAQAVGAAIATGPFAMQLSVLPLLVALYTAATRTRGRAAALSGAISLALVVTGWLVAPEGEADDFWPWLVWAGTWSMGTFVRRRTDAAAEHASRAAVLEVEAQTAAADSAARERDRIARELHDVVAHSVSVMVVQAGAERMRLGDTAGPTRSALEAIEDTGRTALAELRAMLGVLRDGDAEELAPPPRAADVPDLIERVAGAGLPVTLELEPPDLVDAEGRVPPGPSLAAYRIVQEALTNVVRHAPGAATRVVLAGVPGALRVRVENDRSPTAPRPTLSDGIPGRGLVGMRERAAAVGGTFAAGPTDSGGFAVDAFLPGGAGAS